jgi:hypothetical protein
MFMALIQLFIRLAITCITLALRLALAVAALLGRLLGHIIAGIWRSWRNRQADKVPLRAPMKIENSTPEQPAQPTPAQTAATFTPRPMRPTPRR